jgi:hypothetical protein
MTDTFNRRTVLTGTAASAVAAAVPASASAAVAVRPETYKPAAGALAKRNTIWHLAQRMPADPRMWIDAARKAGMQVEIGRGPGDERGVVTMFPDVDPDTRDFVQAWGKQMDTGTILAELEREQGENDRRLAELADLYDRAMSVLGGLEDDDARYYQNQYISAIMLEMDTLEPDTSDGVRSIMHVVEADWPAGAPFWEHLQYGPIENMVRNVLTFARRQGTEAA